MAASPRDRRRATAAALLAATLLAGGCAAPPGKTGSFLLHPLPTAVRGYGLSAGAVRYAGGPIEAELRPLDPRVVERDLAARGVPNPFACGPRSPVLVFGLRLANRGEEVLYFNPANVRGMDDLGGRYFPVSATDVYGLHRDDPRRGELVKAFGSVAFDTPVQVRAGEELTRYLSLGVRQEVPGTLAVSLPLRYGGETGLVLSFPFEAFPTEEGAGEDPGD